MQTDYVGPPIVDEVRCLDQLVRSAATRAPDQAAVIGSDGVRRTWAELDGLVDAEAARVLASGVHPGDRVALRLRGFDFLVGFFGALRAGAIAVPLNPELTERELAAALTHCTPVALLADADDALAHRLARPCGVAVSVPASSAGDRAPRCPRTGEDLAVLCFTSGTETGVPRAAMLSHRALLANVEQCAALTPPPVVAGDRVLLALPMFHVYGLGPGVLQVAAAVGTLVVLDRFDPAESAELMARERVTTVVGVPAMYRAWLRLPGEQLRAAFADVRIATSGAAPLSAELMEAVLAATGVQVYQGYGLTESGPVLTSTLGRPVAKPGSVGGALLGVQLRLLDAAGSPEGEVPDLGEDAGDAGVVAVRGPSMFSGYWPDGAEAPGETGWLSTGDIGFIDSDGDLHLVDRVGDLIIVNGFNVYPHEVEGVLLEHAAVLDAVVVGAPDERTGEAVKAVLVVLPGTELDVAAVQEHCARHLARFKIPTIVELVAELPHSLTGKVARRVVREGA
ncbi:MAG: AMP-binding protein [Mycobacteriaceae bacterium]